RDVMHQVADGNRAIKGVMLESHLFEGNQKLGRVQDLRYGVSITDACMGWDSTADSLRQAAELMRQSRR
ncbi:MAG: 3-deoxy-7-phosphoheptulonate synthase, partial [Betaproteobacteria bacterium]|nr:3-deoxy-7-phosphoheptulonate synthase [Betaproteobacteria bacterium]